MTEILVDYWKGIQDGSHDLRAHAKESHKHLINSIPIKDYTLINILPCKVARVFIFKRKKNFYGYHFVQTCYKGPAQDCLLNSATAEDRGVGYFYFIAAESVLSTTTCSLIYLDFQNLKFKLKRNHVAISW